MPRVARRGRASRSRQAARPAETSRLPAVPPPVECRPVTVEAFRDWSGPDRDHGRQSVTDFGPAIEARAGEDVGRDRKGPPPRADERVPAEADEAPPTEEPDPKIPGVPVTRRG